MKQNNNYTIITARSSSTRLNNKILMNINNKFKTIDIIIKRAKKIGLPIILATTTNKNDNKLIKYVKNHYDIKIFRGSENNKIKRWHDCFKDYNINNSCMIDADDLCFDYNLYKEALKKINKDKYDLIKNNKNLITGLFTYVLNYESLKKTKHFFTDITNTEMAFKYFKKAKLNEHSLQTVKLFKNKKIRLTLDYVDDFFLFKLIYSVFSATTETSTIINFLEKNSYLNYINYDKETNWISNIKEKSK